jgi:hypothetical protein
MSAPNEFDAAAERAAAETDRDLAAEQAGIQPPTWDEVRKMLPDPQDQEALDELIQTVRTTDDHNEKVAALTKNIHRVGSAVIQVLERLR